MKTRILAFAIAVMCMFAVSPAFNDVQAQGSQQRNTIGELIAGLLVVNVEDVEVNIETGDITVVNVEDVLNDADIDILNNVLNNSPILSNNSNILNNLLQDAEILTDNQIVVGILSNGTIVFQNLE